MSCFGEVPAPTGDASASCWAVQPINVRAAFMAPRCPYLLGMSLLKPMAGSSPD